MKKEDLKEIGLVALGFLIVLWFFSRNTGEALRLWYAFIAVMFIPGLLFARWALPDWAAWEQSLFGAFVGFGCSPLLLYYLSYIGLKSIQPAYIIGIAVLSIAGIILLDRLSARHKPKAM